MDIFKLLSRSTKQKNKASANSDVTSQKLPSAGNSTNPQLYHDGVPEARGKKRKRVAGREETKVVADPDGEEVNFFAPRKLAPKANEVNSLHPTELQLRQHEPESTTPERLDEEECRQILRSHRLKLTLLQTKKEGVRETKRSKKIKASKKTSPKDIHKQIYPQPLMAFGDLKNNYGIEGRMSQNLFEQGYKIPTEVQMASLPILLRPAIALEDEFEGDQSVDLLAVAPTGSGKTLAFLIPVVDKIIQRRRITRDKAHKLEAVIIAPTKELASQIVNEARKLCLGTGVKVLGMRKGLNIVGDENVVEECSSEEDEDDEDAENQPKLKQPLSKPDILVTTPGLLLGALSSPGSDVHLEMPSVQTLVLDEADVLLDPLFRDQTLGIWNSCVNPKLHVTLWSATMGSNIETLAMSTIQSRRNQIEASDTSKIVRLVVGLKDSAIPNITHRLIYAATEPGKLIAIRQLLHPTAKTTDAIQSLRPPFLVFTQTIPRAVALHSELLYDIPAEAGGATRIAVLHSDLSDSIRDQVMTRFRNGEIWILITTDILSRGVDFRGINGVVNYDVPNSGASYIHRVGRTGRAGRDGGVAVTFYTKEDIPYVKNIANIIAASEKQAGKAPSEASMQKWLLDALPTPSKDDKKKLKLHGVEARRSGLGVEKKGKGRMQISTKSGYERKLENRRRGAIQGSRRREAMEARDGKVALQQIANDDDNEWGGIGD